MSKFRGARVPGLLALFIAFASLSARAEEIKTVFVIAMENHNWTQPANQFTGSIQQIYQNPAAPFINSLVNGTAVAFVNGHLVNISQQVSYATAYHSVLATPDGNNPHIHPSEPNYIWAEGGSNFGVLNDSDPYSFAPGANIGQPVTAQDNNFHLSTLLTNAGKTWKSYQEDIDLAKDSAGKLTNVPLPQNQWTVPLQAFQESSLPDTSTSTTDPANTTMPPSTIPWCSSRIPPEAAIATPANPMSSHYAPLQQLEIDLANNDVADYNWITPNQFNDMHTALTGGYKGLTGDPAKILQGDDFLSQIIPVIMGSDAYKNHGAIIIWFDESEGDGVAGDNQDAFNHTIGEIVISSRAHANVKGLPYASPVNYTHSSDLKTLQEIFRVGPLVRDAANANDLSDLFDPGAVPKKP